MFLSKNACQYCREGSWVGYDHPECDASVCGARIQHDASGVGHCWRDIDADEIPADTRQEIEGEIIDGGKDQCGLFVANNGLHYRW